MTPGEYITLRSVDLLHHQPLRGVDLEGREDRTLLYGYTTERATFHVYLRDRVIYKKIYGLADCAWECREDDIEIDEHYVPNKRLYPEACDFEFCKLLRQRGVSLPFTTWSDTREKKQFYGEL